MVPGRLPNKGRSCESSEEPQSEGGARNENRPSNNGGLVRHGEGVVHGKRKDRQGDGEGLQSSVYITRCSRCASLSACQKFVEEG